MNIKTWWIIMTGIQEGDIPIEWMPGKWEIHTQHITVIQIIQCEYIQQIYIQIRKHMGEEENKGVKKKKIIGEGVTDPLHE